MVTYLKTFPRMFKKHLTRLVSIFLMVLVSIGFSAGIGMAKDKMDVALDTYYRTAEVPDLTLKCTHGGGFSAEEVALIEDRYGKDNVLAGSSMELDEAGLEVSSPVQMKAMLPAEFTGVTKVYFYDMSPDEVQLGRLTVEEGAAEIPEGAFRIYCERGTKQLDAYPVGTQFQVALELTTPFGPMQNTYTFVVCGTILNPMHFATRLDPSLQFTDEAGEQRELSRIFYLFDEAFFAANLAPAVSDLSVRLPREETPVLSEAYSRRIQKEKEEAETLLGEDCVALTLKENFSFASFHEFGEKIAGIGYVMTVVFLLVTLLVVLSTMTRLIDEERAQVACLTTLGYSPLRITVKYLLFALVGTLIGTVGAYFAGMGLAYIIYVNFTWNFALPPYPKGASLIFFSIVAAAINLATLLATLFTGLRMARKAPAVLLRPKSPKPGKKVILEHIPVLWKRLSFKYKSTLRNVLRYKTRFFMTVVAVMASTALVLAGLAVLDCCLFQAVGTTAMIGVAVAVLFFAALLNAVVIYTLTNINISERERELATLMVLGYQESEVRGYVFREIYITGSIGIALGIPFGALMCYLIFKVMLFGSVAGIGWYVWIAAPLLSLFFTFLVTLMLRGKIRRIRMNESLKANE